VLSEFEALDLSLVSLADSLDLSTPHGRLMMFQIIGAMSEFERSLCRERIMAGLRAAKARGARFGRPPVEVDTAQIQALRAQGRSWRKISAELGEPPNPPTRLAIASQNRRVMILGVSGSARLPVLPFSLRDAEPLTRGESVVALPLRGRELVLWFLRQVQKLRAAFALGP
jgi:resolvase-like protein